MYHVIWESLYIDKQLFIDYYVTFCKAYVKGIDAAKERGEVSTEIDSEVLAWTLMGASNFLGLKWGLFEDRPTKLELDRVTESFMRIIDGGTFTKECLAPSQQESQQPIRIQVEFDDDELEDDEEECGDGPGGECLHRDSED